MSESTSRITTVHVPVALYSLRVESPVALGIIALAWSFDKTGGLRASNNTLAGVFYMHRQNIIRVVNKLRDDGMVNVEKVVNGRVIKVTAEIRRLLGSLQLETSSGLQLETTESESSLQLETRGSLKSETEVVSGRRPKPKEEKKEVKGKRTRTPSRPRGRKPFTPPEAKAVNAYAAELGYGNFSEPNKGAEFVAYYAERDWKDSKGKPVKNWKAKLRNVWLSKLKKPERGDFYWLPSEEELDEILAQCEGAAA